MKVSYIYILVISSVLLFGCKKEKGRGPETKDIGQFDLLETTIQQFPYNNSNTQFIFTDSLNNEFSASIIMPIFKHYSASKSLIGYTNSNYNFYLVYHSQAYNTLLSIPSLNKDFHIGSEVKVDTRDLDRIRVADITSVYASHQSTTDPIFIVSNNRTWQANFPRVPNLPQATFSIHGKVFNNVYSNQNDSETIIYFNFDQGIVGFKDLITGISYKLK